MRFGLHLRCDLRKRAKELVEASRPKLPTCQFRQFLVNFETQGWGLRMATCFESRLL